MEFALVGMVVIVLMFGVLEVGFLMSNTLTLNNAAFEGVRAVSLHKGEADATTAIQRAAASLNSAYIGAIVFEKRTGSGEWTVWHPSSASPLSGDDWQVRVTVPYSYHYVTGSLIGNIIGNGDPNVRALQGTAVMRYR